MFKSFPLLLASLFFSTFAAAQRGKIDSVLALLKGDKEDRVKVTHLRQLCSYHKTLSSIDSTIYYGELGLALSEKLGLKPETSDFHADMGLAYEDKGDHPKSLEHFLKSLRIAESLKDKRRIADNYVRMGSLFDMESDYTKALKNYYTALPLYEELGMKERISMVTGNIGNVYVVSNSPEKALEFYLKALAIDKELNLIENMKYSLGYIGMAYASLAKKNKSKHDSLNTLSANYFKEALKMAEELNDKGLVINWLGNMGILYADEKKYKESEKYLLRALALADSMNLAEEKMQFENAISEIYYTMGDYKRSIDHYKKYTREKDSMFTAEKNRELTKHEMNYEFDKKMSAIKSEQEKKEAVAQARSKQQTFIIILVISGLIIMFVALLIILRSLRVTRLQKTVIEKQKHLVDEKQKEIIDSINYARRIQQSLLTTETYIHKTLNRMSKK